MAIPPEFSSKYANEAQFREQFLIPLLHRLGYSIVVNYHGTQEFGKDLIFGEIDPFGHVRYHALQAKYVPSIGQGESHDLVNDCKEAFTNPFRHPQTGAQESIDLFFIANGGTFGVNTKSNVFNAMRAEHGGHIRMIDGLGLLALDRAASLRRTENISAQLTGLRLECAYNITMLNHLEPKTAAKAADEKQPIPAERFRLSALQDYLIRPFPLPEISTDRLQDTWHRADVINRWLEGCTGMRTPENRRELIQRIQRELPKSRQQQAAILTTVTAMMQSLGPIAADSLQTE